MEKEFWDNRWQTKEIAFHLEDVNPLLIKHFNKLPLKSGDRVFVPLCGKTKDINWLLSNSFQVVGIELNPIAVSELFEELKVKPQITKVNDLILYSFNNLQVYLGDFFKLTSQLLGKVDVIYDRAALVALPESMRKEYSKHLIKITNGSPQLLIVYDYDQSLLDGPPFSVVPDEIQSHYSKSYLINKLDEVQIEGGLKKKCKASETVWMLTT
jgi:thiopurine S-methyltransferase